MEKREELQVIRIESIEDAQIAKTNYPRKGYATKVLYILEDGRQLPSSMRAGKLKDLKAKLLELPKDVNNERVIVENDVITMSITSYSLFK